MSVLMKGATGPELLRAYEHACQLAPDRVEAWVGWARSMYEFADFAASDAILSDFVGRHPENATGFLERAGLRRKAKRTDKAWSDVNEAIRLAPENGDAWALKGDLCIDLATFQDAFNSFQKAKQYLPDSPWPVMGLYHSAIELKDLPAAEASARELRQRFPEQIEGRFYLGEVLLESATDDTRVTSAVKELEEAETLLTREPLDNELVPMLKLLLGRAYYAQKNYTKAKSYLEASVKITPDNADAMFFLGRTYRALGEKKKRKRC
ncbi:MAG: tetratricopeptide repeat protein [Armatimonas sp.]